MIHELHIHRLWRRGNDQVIKQVVQNSSADKKVESLLKLIDNHELIGPYWWLKESDYSVHALKQSELEHALHQVEDGRTMLHAMMQAQRRHHKKSKMGARHPVHFWFLSKILKWYPEARILFLRRSFSDIAKSWVHKRIPDDVNLFLSVILKVMIWVHTYVNAFFSLPLLWRWRKDPRVMVVHYSELVNSPKRVFRTICRHFRIEFHPEMADHSTVFDSAFQAGDPQFPGKQAGTS